MDINEALKMVRALANGMDPESGVQLEGSSIIRRPLIVKALNRAIGALVVEERRLKEKPANAFRYWSKKEDQQMLDELRKGTDIDDVAKAHNRSVASIAARLVRLGKLGAPGKPPEKVA